MDARSQLLRDGTPVEDHMAEFGLFVKREDLSARPPGPPFSKTRGVYAHIAALPPRVETLGVLDTYHSQAGHAVAHAASVLGLEVINFYPEYKNEPGHRAPQDRAAELGAELVGLPAGRSAILFHQAKKELLRRCGTTGYMMPNALKLPEMVEETAREVALTPIWPDRVIIPASSATIAAGVIRGFIDKRIEGQRLPRFIIHMGYQRSFNAVCDYILKKVDRPDYQGVHVVDEGYGYKDQARPGATPPWPCSPYYDLKAFRWWQRVRDQYEGSTLLWNVG